MKPIITKRLIIRPFRHNDLGEIYRIMDVELKYKESIYDDLSINNRKQWLDWTIMSYYEITKRQSLPFVMNAVVLRESLELIGMCGLKAETAPLGYLPEYRYIADVKQSDENYLETGIFAAISPHYQCRGFAYEALKSLIEKAFDKYNLSRVIGITEMYNNPALAVIKRLGMRIGYIQTNKFNKAIGIIDKAGILNQKIKRAI